MERLTWTQALSVGVPELDDQHKEFLEMLNFLAYGIEEGHALEILVETLMDMSGYLENHFETEEAYLRRRRYPDLQQHCAEHEEFRRKADAFMDAFNGDQEHLAERIYNFLRGWFLTHIQVTDQKYKRFIEQTQSCGEGTDGSAADGK